MLLTEALDKLTNDTQVYFESEKKILMKNILKEPLAKPNQKEIKTVPENTEDEMYSKTTIFVSTIPYQATSEQLEELFSSIGPIRQCFIIKKEGKSAGCGYVQFALPEDVEKALKLKDKFMDRTLKITRALKKGTSVEQRQQLTVQKLQHKQHVVKKQATIVTKDAELRSKAIQITNLPLVSKKALYKKVRKSGQVKELTLDEPNQSAMVMYASYEDASKAQKQLHDHIFKGSKLVVQLTKTITPESIAKKSRLIIRNLAFQTTTQNLKTVFEVFGEVVDVQVPKTADGKARGFGFVQYKDLESAQKAIDTVNGQKVLGRLVAVDWALGKAEYDRLASQGEGESLEEHQESAQQVESEQTKDSEMESDADEGEINESDSDKEESEMENEVDGVDLDVQSESDGESEDGSEAVLAEPVSNKREPIPEGCTLFVRNLSFDTNKRTLHETFSNWGPLRYAVVTMDKATGLSKGNGFVAFELEEDAEQCLQDYEEASRLIHTTGLVTDQVVLDSKKDKTKKSILTPVVPESTSAETTRFHVDGRFISVTPAVSKQIATKLTQASIMNKRATDKRHLYLMREGVIFPGSEAAALLTPEELEQRTAQYATRKRLLATNPNLFISRTRLSVRGMHPKLTDAQLKQAARISINGFWDDVAAGLRKPLEEEVAEEEKQQGFAVPNRDRKIVILQAKLIRDADRLDPETKKPKSKGYGFIEFKSHADALACLRYMNNNSTPFAKAMGEEQHSKNSKNKKPVVEFAVENNLVIKKRKEREASMKKRKAESGEQPAKRKKGETDKPEKRAEKVVDTEKDSSKKKSKQTSRKDSKQTKNAVRSAPVNDQPAKKESLTSKTKESSVLLKQKKNTSKVSKKSKDTTEKPSKRQIQRAKKVQEEEKFQSLVDNYKKKLLDNVVVKPTTTSKWYS